MRSLSLAYAIAALANHGRRRTPQVCSTRTRNVSHGHRHEIEQSHAQKDKTRPKPPRKPKEPPPEVGTRRPSELKNTLAQIEKQFGEGAIMPLGTDTAAGSRAFRPAACRWIWPWAARDSQGPHRRDLRPRIERQDDAGPARRRPGPASRRHRRIYRRRACLGPELGQETGRRAGDAAGQPARAAAKRRCTLPRC